MVPVVEAKNPSGHASHSSWPSLKANVPSGHSKQSLEEFPGWKNPDEQSTQFTWSNVDRPAGHNTHSQSPVMGACVLLSLPHAVHTLSPVVTAMVPVAGERRDGGMRLVSFTHASQLHPRKERERERETHTHTHTQTAPKKHTYQRNSWYTQTSRWSQRRCRQCNLYTP